MANKHVQTNTHITNPLILEAALALCETGAGGLRVACGGLLHRRVLRHCRPRRILQAAEAEAATTRRAAAQGRKRQHYDKSPD